MKKILAILLIACMMLSVTAMASETTFAEPFTIFDFGSESRLDDMWKPFLLSEWELVQCMMEENDDSWTLVVTEITTDWGNNTPGKWKLTPHIRCDKISNITYGAYMLNNGWGTYEPTGYNEATGEWTYDNASKWVGKNQYMKIRLKNLSSNTCIGMYPVTSRENVPASAASAFKINANDTEFQTYIIDMCKAQAIGAEKGDCYQYLYSKTEQTYTDLDLNAIFLLPFGAFIWHQYGDTSYATYKNVQVGDTVEIDYMIFAPTAEMAAEYKSIDEGSDLDETITTTTTTTTTKTTTTTTTTTVADETTTTVADETTTTVVEETTTTVADETTTTVADETTTTVANETTTTVADSTTTTVADSNDTEGGFPVWIIIVAVVVIGGGVAAIFVFKKK